MQHPNSIQSHKYYPLFKAYTDANPKFLDTIAVEMKERALKRHKRCSVKRIIEDLRDNATLHKIDDFKISNNIQSLVSETIHFNYPELRHLFERRVLRAVNN